MSRLNIGDLTPASNINTNSFIELYTNISSTNRVSVNIGYSDLKTYLEEEFTNTSHNIFDVFYKTSCEKTFEYGCWPMYSDDKTVPNWVNDKADLKNGIMGHSFSFDYIANLKKNGLIKAQYVDSTNTTEIANTTYMLELAAYGYTSSFLIDINKNCLAVPILNDSYIRNVSNVTTLNALNLGTIQQNILKAHKHLYYISASGNTGSIINIAKSSVYNEILPMLTTTVSGPVNITKNIPKTVNLIPHIQILSKIPSTSVTKNIYNVDTNVAILDYIKNLDTLPIGTIISIPLTLNTAAIEATNMWQPYTVDYIKGSNSYSDVNTEVNYYTMDLSANSVYSYFDHYHGTGNSDYGINRTFNYSSGQDDTPLIKKSGGDGAYTWSTIYTKQGNRGTTNVFRTSTIPFSYVPASYNIKFYRKYR